MQTKPFEGGTHPRCPVLLGRYAHVAVAVTDEEAAKVFYGHLGFEEDPKTRPRQENVVVLRNLSTAETFEVHLLTQSAGTSYQGPFGRESGVNVLMDIDGEKYPG